MDTMRRGISGCRMVLFLAAEKAFTEREICYMPEDGCLLQIPADELVLTEPFLLSLKLRERGIWELNGKTAGEEHACILETGAGEKVLVLLYEKRKSMAGGKRIFLKGGQQVHVGRNFNNEIVYRCFSGIEPVHLSLEETEEGLLAEVCQGEADNESGYSGRVYRERIRMKRREILAEGETIQLLGLSILYLKGLLFCSAGFGTLRISLFEERPVASWTGRNGAFSGGGRKEKISCSLSARCLEEWPVTEGELTIGLPEKEMVQNRQPLLLTVGPSLTMILPMLLTTLLAGRLQLGNGYGKGFFRTGLLMTGISSLLTVLWGSFGYLYRRIEERRDRKGKRKEYLSYLRETEEYLQELMEQNRRALLHNAPEGSAYLEEGSTAYSGSIYAEQYSFLRLGLADMEAPFQAKLGGELMHRRTELYHKAQELTLRFRKLMAVPAGFDFRKERIVGFAGEKGYEVLWQALLQLVACHSAREVRLACFYRRERKEDEKLAEGIRWLPHIWTEAGKRRFLAGNEKETGEILPEIGRFLSEKGRKRFFLMLILDPALVCSEDIYENLCRKEGEETAVWFLAGQREEIPAVCSCLVRNDCRSQEILKLQGGSERIADVKFDQAGQREIQGYMRKLYGSDSQREGQEMIPDRISFLSLYGAERAEELHCDRRYQEYRVLDRLKVPIGAGSGGRKIFLDIHEKFHGPHGLVAGTTGSGKSELLQTFLLSLAVSFRPDELSFFIIDYKGGGMGRELQMLPHCAGLISNLSGGQIHRALVSVKSENRRRQRLLKEAGVSHVSDYAVLYRDGLVEEALPHLLIVVDEFAELKKEIPEFMQEIISVSQVGRSLGVHLLLSTQKPAGTVDDRIFSNTGFRLCLRVADRQDSMDMLKRPEAASLTGSGRCYLQVGNQEVFELFQTGYCGEIYEKDRKEHVRAAMVTETGKRIRRRKEKGKMEETELQAVIRYIREVTEKRRIMGNSSLWMPELPEKVDLPELQCMKAQKGEKEQEERKESRGSEKKMPAEYFLGLVDDPQNQQQYPLTYHPKPDGNLLLCGMAATGKSTFLQTFLYQLASAPAGESCFLLISMDNLSLSCFQDMPGCLGILQNAENVDSFFYHTEKLFRARKKELAGMNYWQDRERRGREKPLLFLLIDDYGSFRELTGDRYQELIEKMAREGNSYGIYLILTASGAGKGEVQGRLLDQCKTTFCLEMSDVVQYAEVLRKYHIEVIPQGSCRGRGLCRKGEEVLEVQFALCNKERDDYGRIEEIQKLCLKKTGEQGSTQRKFPCIPAEPTFEGMYHGEEQEDTVWIGYAQKTAKKVALSFGRGSFFLISGAEGSGRRTLMCGLLYAILHKGERAALLEGRAQMRGRLSFLQEERKGSFCDLTDAAGIEAWITAEGDQQKYLCIADPEEFHRIVTEAEREGRRLGERLEEACKGGLRILTIFQTGQEMNLCAGWLYEKHKASPFGIHLGGNAGNQRLLSFADLPYSRLNQRERPGIGYLTEGAHTVIVRLPQEIREEKHDIGRDTGTGAAWAL